MASKPRVTLNQADPKVLGKAVSHDKTKPGKRGARKTRRKAVADATSLLKENAAELYALLREMRKNASKDELEKEMLGVFKKLLPTSEPKKKTPSPTEKMALSEFKKELRNQKIIIFIF